MENRQVVTVVGPVADPKPVVKIVNPVNPKTIARTVKAVKTETKKVKGAKSLQSTAANHDIPSLAYQASRYRHHDTAVSIYVQESPTQSCRSHLPAAEALSYRPQPALRFRSHAHGSCRGRCGPQPRRYEQTPRCHAGRDPPRCRHSLELQALCFLRVHAPEMPKDLWPPHLDLFVSS